MKDKDSIQVWDKIADLYQEKFMDLKIYNESYDAFLDSLAQGSRLLEIACGPGNISNYLNNKRPDIHIYAIDSSSKMIELAKKNVIHPHVQFECKDARDLSEGTYDAILAGFILPYLKDQELSELLFNCEKMISGKGTLYLSYVEGDESLSGIQKGSSGDSLYFHYHSKQKMKKLIDESNFKIEKEFLIEYESAKGMDIHKVILLTKG